MPEIWEETLEKMADLEHRQWSHWTAYMLRTLLKDHPELMTDHNVVRWSRQILIDYQDLTETEKDSDREWAEKAMYLMRDFYEYI